MGMWIAVALGDGVHLGGRQESERGLANGPSRRMSAVPERDQSAEEWARGVQLSGPVRWGAVEDEVFARPAPRPIEETRADRVIRAIGLVLMGILAIPAFGASVVGLVLFLVGVDPVVVRIFFVVAAGFPVAMVLTWWDTRERGLVRITASGSSGLVSLVAYLLMRSGPMADRDAWAALFMLVAVVTGVVAAVVMLVASKAPEQRRRGPRGLSPAKGVGYLQARNRVLGILVERGVVELDPDMQKKMTEMPLGCWHELDQDAAQ